VILKSTKVSTRKCICHYHTGECPSCRHIVSASHPCIAHSRPMDKNQPCPRCGHNVRDIIRE
jgi:hypothetical protein